MPENNCPECGTKLDSGECPRCLLQAALASGTDFLTVDPGDEPTGRGDEPTVDYRQSADAVTVSSEANAENTEDGLAIGAYRQLTAIRDWSNGTVYDAYHPGLGRAVVLRVLEASADTEARVDFLRRAELLSQLDHPTAVRTYEAGVLGDVVYVAEEKVRGRKLEGFLPLSLSNRFRNGFYPVGDLTAAMRAVASALHSIHQLGLYHDRLNPDSLWVDDHGTVRMIDVGVESEASDERFAAPDDRWNKSSIAADLYRLGATFCYLTTGRTPDEMSSQMGAGSLARELRRCNRGIPEPLAAVIATCLQPPRATDHEKPQPTLQPNPYVSGDTSSGQRYSSAEEIFDELDRLSRRQIRRAAWRPRVYSVLVEGLLLMIAFGLAFRGLFATKEGDPSSDSWLALLLLTTPALYVIVFETAFGWTPVRRLFGLTLVDQSGSPARWWRRMLRVLAKSAIAALVLVLPALAIPLLHSEMSFYVLGLTPIFSLVGPLLLLYAPAYFVPCRWPLYDLLCGATWGREAACDDAQRTRLNTAPQATTNTPPVDQCDQYDLYAPLGQGGMGQVYRGRDRVLQRDVAIKVLADPLAGNPMLLDRFRREARLAARVSHPNVATVFGNGVWNDKPYIAMELVSGENLQEKIKARGRLPVIEAWRYVMQAARALKAADACGVIHRDVKPANLMVSADGELKVTDFGVSRQLETDGSVTEAGTIVGTPAYMAPEQARGKDVDCRSDIYALGMTLYHMLSGRPPFCGKNPLEVLAQQMSEAPAPLLGQIQDWSEERDALLRKMIVKRPEDRYQNYDELLRDLSAYAPRNLALAGPLNRIGAEVCNLTGSYLLFTVTIFALFLFGKQLGLNNRSGTLAVGYAMSILYVGFVAMYVLGVAWGGRTPGKRLLGLQVQTLAGGRVGLIRSLVRFAVTYPALAFQGPLLIWYVIRHTPAGEIEKLIGSFAMFLQPVVVIVSLLLVALHPRRRALHDLAAGTIVVRQAGAESIEPFAAQVMPTRD